MNKSSDHGAGVEKGNGRSLHWHLLGGNNKSRIGMNSGLCVYEETDSLGQKQTRRLLFDAGLMSGDPRRPEDPGLVGSDTIIPHLGKYLHKPDDPDHQPEEPLDAIFLTHSHSDHIGALPFMVLLGYALPRIYATPYTAKRLEQEFSNTGIDPEDWPQIITIAPGMPVQEGAVKVSPFWVSHSTPQSVGFHIETPEGNIVNPGDFKLDQTVIWGPAFHEEQLQKLLSKPVDLLLLDSTGADRDIVPTREEDVRDNLSDLMQKHRSKRFVIAVLSGCEENVASVAKVAAQHNRTVWVAGAAHEQSMAALKATGLTLSDSIGEEVDVRTLGSAKSVRELGEARPRDSVVIVTGAQGSPGAALTRAADGHHPHLKLDPKRDIVLFCAPVIPGQEGQHARLMARLKAAGIKTLTRKDTVLYSQAHARLPELVDMVKMVKPKTLVPIHGSEELRGASASAFEKMGQKTMMADNGDVLRISKDHGVDYVPEKKKDAHLIGFKTLQGTSWADRHYVMTEVPVARDEKRDPANTDTPAPKSKRPQIFKANP